ncbi:hypothetical protein [Erythrobacter sp. YT30]|uniref:hypothetical protein n=1 Tax=Erythrobacter sp. YT30 TaxID=1735012 RepID=UPI00076CE4B1|nr:hypothetical protein [Erythrobacter sp. YT30]KWV90543.1 hypothetical protein AUC45_15035 [Erythrobacter sp. YT30]
MTRKPLPYADLTLEEALVQFRAESGLTHKYDAMGAKAQMHFERHDIIHVLFGLTTNLRDEAQADGWTLMASDIGMQDIRTFMQLPEEKSVIKEVGWWALAKGFFASLPDYAAIAWRSRKMRKKWRWSDNAQYRQQQVSAIRDEFGIAHALAD